MDFGCVKILQLHMEGQEEENFTYLDELLHGPYNCECYMTR